MTATDPPLEFPGALLRRAGATKLDVLAVEARWTGATDGQRTKFLDHLDELGPDDLRAELRNVIEGYDGGLTSARRRDGLEPADLHPPLAPSTDHDPTQTAATSDPGAERKASAANREPRLPNVDDSPPGISGNADAAVAYAQAHPEQAEALAAEERASGRGPDGTGRITVLRVLDDLAAAAAAPPADDAPPAE